MNKITEDIGTGKPGPGRPKGAVNKTTSLAKEAIAFAAEGLGGADRLIVWAQEDAQNERAFWTQIYTKLLPLQVNAEHDLTKRAARALAWKPPQ
jgi:hypothetical protein